MRAIRRIGVSMRALAFVGFVAIAVSMTAATDRRTVADSLGARSAAGPRVQHAMGYYDAALQRVVLIGGAGQPRAADRDSLWSWSGAHWEPLGLGPPARTNAGVAYDGSRGLAAVTGGARRAADDSTFEVMAHTWLGDATSWRPLNGPDVPPRDHNALVHDEARGALLLFGGIPADRATPWPSDTWQLRPEGWVRIATEGPAGRARTALTYDSRRRQVVLFGGVGAQPGRGQPQPFFNDTWIWEGSSWRRVAADGPPARYAHGMVFDERAGVVLLYSGAAAHRDAPLTDMWQWDGRRWTEIHLSGPTPGFRYQPTMVYDRARGRTVLFGGMTDSTGATWEWDGTRWSERGR
ncbi:MAG: hypothetical protein SFV24_17640 [Gemmatimonadales bacterium]|nr:hypothetical protein [Gemmatimonadales bacterium]